MKTKTILALTLILLAATALPALAQCGHAPRDGEAPRFERMTRMLDLSEAQQAAIKKIREESRDEGLQTRKQIMRLRHELQGLMLEDDPDAGEAGKLIKRIGELKSEQQVRRMETRLAVRAELTDEQRDKMMAMQGKKKRGRGGPGRRSGCDGHGRHGGEGACGGPRGR